MSTLCWEVCIIFFFSSRRRHTRFDCDWSSDVCSSDLQVNGLEDAIHRCRRYKEAGADALFVEAPSNAEELGTIARELPPPLVANMLEGGVTPLLTKRELEKIGFQLVVCPLTALYASAKAMQEMFSLLQTAGTTRTALDRLISFQQFHDLIGLPAHYALDERYRSPEEG